MEELKLSAITNKSPLVDFNPENGALLLQGTSCMENARSFYTALITWVEDYAKNAASQTHLQISLNYFNTSSAKCLLELLEKAIAIHALGKGQTALGEGEPGRVAAERATPLGHERFHQRAVEGERVGPHVLQVDDAQRRPPVPADHVLRRVDRRRASGQILPVQPLNVLPALSHELERHEPLVRRHAQVLVPGDPRAREQRGDILGKHA